MFRHEDSQNCLGKNKYINNIRQFKQSQIDKKQTNFVDKSEFITFITFYNAYQRKSDQ